VAQDQIFLLSDSCGFVDVRRPHSREDGSVIYRGHSQRYTSSIFTVAVVNVVVSCGYISFTVLYLTLVHMYVQYI
jgi:hypothetical protein